MNYLVNTQAFAFRMSLSNIKKKENTTKIFASWLIVIRIVVY